MEDNLMNSTICYNIYYELKNQVGINNFHFIYDDNYTNNDRTPLIKYLNDIREINNNNGYLFNKKYLYHIYYYNNESKILKNERDEYYFYKKNTHKYIPYQWIGIYLDYIFTNNILNKNNQQLIDINIEFSIKLLKNINNNDKENYGIKTHEPLKYYNKWFEECIYNEFTNIKLLIKILPKSQYIILNFDEYFEETIVNNKGVEMSYFIVFYYL
jgi:hypothetical protein